MIGTRRGDTWDSEKPRSWLRGVVRSSEVQKVGGTDAGGRGIGD